MTQLEVLGRALVQFAPGALALWTPLGVLPLMRKHCRPGLLVGLTALVVVVACWSLTVVLWAHAAAAVIGRPAGTVAGPNPYRELVTYYLIPGMVPVLLLALPAAVGASAFRQRGVKAQATDPHNA